MAERRSLAAGIDGIGGVDPMQARAFILQEKSKTEEAKPQPLRAIPNDAGVEMKVEHAAELANGGEGGSSATPRRTKASGTKRPDTSRLLATLLVPVTVRLRPEIAGALKRASLERQLNGITMFTQQDIVEEALLPWLQAEGLLD